MTEDSISHHLLELRNRLLKVIALFALLSVLGIPFAADIYEVIALPLNELCLLAVPRSQLKCHLHLWHH